MPYRITFPGRWQGVLQHVFADWSPEWDPETGTTSIVVADQPSLTSVIDRASELGLTVLDVRRSER